MREFKIIKENNWIIGVKNDYRENGFLERIKELFLNPKIEKEKFPSRGIKPVFSFIYNNEEFIFRFYQHGGIAKGVFKDIFLFNPAIKEISLIEKLRKNEILTFEPIGFVSKKYFAAFFRTALVTKRMLGYENLLTYLKEEKNFSTNNKKITGNLINVLRNLYNLNFYHNDLNVKNFLINPKNLSIAIIDWKKCRLKHRVSSKDKVKNIIRLNRSLEKYGIKVNDKLKMKFFLNFIREYAVSVFERKQLMKLCNHSFYLHKLTWEKQKEIHV